jgi:hypothetical protein
MLGVKAQSHLCSVEMQGMVSVYRRHPLRLLMNDWLGWR